MENSNTPKKTIFSGLQPSGILTIGNYLGALRNWVKLQEEYNTYYCIVDMHAITVRQDPGVLKKRCLELLALYIACGLDPEKNTMYFQSHVSAHAELSWLLTCNAYMGELSRMTQFKDKSAKQGNNIGAGLLTYPVLMAADILLYQTDIVPIGSDQKQHLELARDIAVRFNTTYSETFKVPEPYMPKSGARIMSLAEPTQKMSKSDPNANAVVYILDKKDDIIRKFRRAVTDSGSEIVMGEGKDGINNLITIYSVLSGKTCEEVEREFAGKGYGDFKTAVGELCADVLRPVQEEYARLIADKKYLEEVMKLGAERASYAARRTLSKVKRKMGFTDIPR